MSTATDAPPGIALRRPPATVRVAIIGSGFAGLGLAIQLSRTGTDDFVILERGDEVGGTWRDNTYPGAACDVPSHLYSYSFAPNPDWSRSFSPQPEIQAYLQRCADRFGVRDRVRLGCDVTSATWHDEEQRWHLETTGGPVVAELLVSAAGALSEPSTPDLPGLDRFEGNVFHSARWDHDADLAGRRVAVVGTGASAIQFVPEIAADVAHLDVYQRTAPWILPRWDRAVTPVERWLYRRIPAAQRAVRNAIYAVRETHVVGFRRPNPVMRAPERLARRHLARQVPDAGLRAKLTPDYTIGCKRILLSSDYYPTLAKPSVDVVTDAIAEVGPRAIVAADGTERAVDTIIFGTGFRVTDYPIAHRIRGRDGRTLGETWRGGMQAHAGTTVAGFPNLFLLVGPNTGLGHNSMVLMMEAQFDYVLDALRTMARVGAATVEVRPQAQARYNAELQARMRGTVWTGGGCASWYLDDQGRNTTLWPDFTWRFRRRLRRFDSVSYDLRPPTRAHPGGVGVVVQSSAAASAASSAHGLAIE